MTCLPLDPAASRTSQLDSFMLDTDPDTLPGERGTDTSSKFQFVYARFDTCYFTGKTAFSQKSKGALWLGKRDICCLSITLLLCWARGRLTRKKNKAIVQLACTGDMTADQNLWSIGLHDHCISKHSGASSAQELNIGFHTFLSTAETWRIENRPMPKLTLSHIVRAKTGLSKGTSSGGGSRLTADMLCVLPLTFCFCS